MMTSLLIIYGKFILSSLMLLAFYFGVLRKRATYRFMRLYLLLIPVVSVMMSGLTFEVYKPKPIIVESAQHTNNAEVTVSNAKPIFNAEAVNDIAIDWGQMVLYAIAAVSVILILIAVFYIIKMYLLARKMKAEKTEEGFNLVRSAEVKTPFSFVDTIFMPVDIDGDKENMILQHEKAHILYKHYVDVWMIEFMTRLLWFNPILWITRNQLRNIHEYEADRCVLDAGADIVRYQTFLLEEVAEDSVIIANGFNHSFIRRRFIEMKRKTVGTLGKFGKAGTALWILVLFCSFTFTIGKAEVIIPQPQKGEGVRMVNKVMEDYDKEETIASEEVEDSVKEVEALVPVADNKQTKQDGKNDGFPRLTNLPANTHSDITYKGVKLRRTESATYLDCIATCESNDELWSLCGWDTYLIDANTNDHYKARSCSVPDAWNTKFHVVGMKGKTWMITLVFPPLKESVTYIKVSGVYDWDINWSRVFSVKELE